MRVIPGNAQHIGDRESQEDAFGFSSFGDRAFERHGGVMMVLCDGMGGLANGAAASRAAVDAVLSGYYRKQPSEDIASALDRAIREAHQAVCVISGDGGTAGSTIVVAVVWQDRLYWASLGDSRLYLCRGDASAVQLTEDHNVASLLERRVAHGESSQKEAATTTDREALTAYLGSPYQPQPSIGRDGMPLRPSDRIVACSDGLYRGSSPEAIAATSRHADPMTAAEQMIESVLGQRLPHQDNLTVVLFEVAPDHRPIEIPITPMLGLVLGAAAGFAVAVVLVVVLISFNILQFPPTGRHLVGPVVPGQLPDPTGGSAGLPATHPPEAPPPAKPGGEAPRTQSKSPPTTLPSSFSKLPPAVEKPSPMPAGSDKGTGSVKGKKEPAGRRPPDPSGQNYEGGP